MLLKGDEGGCKNLGGVAENGDFRQGGHYPLDDLGVTSNRDPHFSPTSLERFRVPRSPRPLAAQALRCCFQLRQRSNLRGTTSTATLTI